MVLSLAKTVVVNPPAAHEEDQIFLIDVKYSPLSKFIAVPQSNHSILIYALNFVTAGPTAPLHPAGQLIGHNQTITDFCFSPTDPATAYSCSTEGSIATWDLRTFTPGSVKEESGEVLSISVNSDGTRIAVAVGCEVKLYDLATGSLLVNYDEVHTKDVTQVRFDPLLPTRLFTSSIDGLVCVLDTSVTDPDDALVGVLNIEDPVNTIVPCGAKGNEFLFVATSNETVSVWNTETLDRVFNAPNAREALSQPPYGVQADYFFECKWMGDKLFVIGGSHSGDVLILECQGPSTLAPVELLRGGHAATVRGMSWDVADHMLFTVGEDSRICIWAS